MKYSAGHLIACLILVLVSARIPAAIAVSRGFGNSSPSAQESMQQGAQALKEGRVLLERGQEDQALVSLQNALSLFKAANDPKGIAAASDALGDLYVRQGQYAVALKYYESAHEAFGQDTSQQTVMETTFGMPDNEFNANLMLAKIGDTNFRMGNISGASAAYGRMRAEKPDPSKFTGGVVKKPSMGGLLSGGGLRGSLPSGDAASTATAVAGAVRGAIELYRQNIIYSTYKMGEGRIDYFNNSLDSSKKHFTNALATAGMPIIGKFGQSRLVRAAARTSLGDIALRQNNVKDALKFYGDAVKGAREDKRFDLVWPAQRGLGKAHWMMASQEKDLEKAQKGREEAIAFYREALQTIETIRQGSPRSDEARTTFLVTTKDVYDETSGSLAEMALLTAPRGGALDGQALTYAAEAFMVVEQGRARSLLEMLSESEADITEGLPADLVKWKHDNLDRQREIGRQLSGVTVGEVAEKPRTDKLEAELETLSADYDSIENQIRAASPKYAALTAPQPLTLTEVQQRVLDDKTALLEYSLGSEGSYLWAVTRTSAALFKLPARSEIDQQAQALRGSLIPPRLQSRIVGIDVSDAQRGIAVANDPDALSGAASAFATASHALYKTAVEPAARIVGNKRLLVVADGGLNYIPFESLVTAMGGTDYSSMPYLIKTNEVVYAPSASVIAIIRESAKPVAGENLLLVADPVFNEGDPRVRGTTAASQRASIDSRGLSLSSALTDVAAAPSGGARAPGGPQLARLKGTRVEAQEIAQLTRASGLKADVWFDLEANEAKVTTSDLTKYRVVHIATHGLLNAERPQFTGMVLSLVGNKSGDGFMRTNEIFNLRLGSPLVMLSGCETGLGREKRGEGVIGLTRAFMYAGAPTVGVSLWSVADNSTAELMTSIYRQMFTGQRLSAVAAKRAAQVAMIQNKRYSAPFYWAPFVLSGEWAEFSHSVARVPADNSSSTTMVERYPKMEYPDPVIAESKFDLLVSLTVDSNSSQATVENGEATRGGGIRIPLMNKEMEVVLIAPDFVFLDTNSAPMIVKADGDSTPARFRLQAKPIQGSKQTSKVYATLWYGNSYLGKISRDVTVVNPGFATRSPSEDTRGATQKPVEKNDHQSIKLDSRIESDLTVIICDSPNTDQPEITVVSSYLPRRKPESVSIKELSAWLNVNFNSFFNLSARRAELNRGRDIGSILASLKNQSKDALRGFGRQLYQEFAPPSFKKAFWDLYQKRGSRFKSIQIYSDNMEIPWELMIPVSPDGSQELGFLGVEYAIGRWHFSQTAAGLDPPPQTLSLNKLILIAPEYKGHVRLPSQEEEIKTLKLIRGSEIVRGLTRDVRTLFQNFPQGLIHFAGHGTIVSPQPTVYQYSIQLEDGPLDVTSWRGITKSRSNHPFLFFNACDVGQTHRIANFVDGWAPAVLEEGAGGYIGALWPVSDSGAAEFGVAFYKLLDRKLALGPTSVADVVRETRMRFLENGDPTFLAYVYFGDVNLSLVSMLNKEH